MTLRITQAQTELNEDIFVSALGYERRCTYAAYKLVKNFSERIAVRIADRKIYSFEKSMAWYSSNGFKIHAAKQLKIELTEAILRTHSTLDRSIGITIDVSSMSRSVIADIIGTLMRTPCDIRARFVYCPAEFLPPGDQIQPVVQRGPVTGDFAGWSNRPDLPPTLILGLGYEYGRALGSLEYLEPSAAWAFSPFGDDTRYENAVARANADLCNLIPSTNLITYHVPEPFELCERLDSLIYGLLKFSRPTIVPFGPKIFALASMLVAKVYDGRVSVWRVSGDQSEEAIDRRASGRIVFLHCDFDR